MKKHKKQIKSGKRLLLLSPFPVLLIISFWIFIVLKSYFLDSNFPPVSMFFYVLSSFNVASAPDAPGFIRAFIVHFSVLLFGSGIFFSALGWGKLFFKNLIPDQKLSFFYEAGLGFGVLVMLAFAIGHAGLLVPVFLYLFLFAGLVAFYFKRKEFQFPLVFSKSYYLIILAGILIVALAGSLTPSTFYDSMVYHLAIPKYWLFAEGIEIIPFVSPSYYPLNMEVLFTYALGTVGYTSAAKIINLTFFLLTLWALYNFTIALTKSKKAAYVAAFIYGTTPFVLMQTWRTGNELGQAFWELLAFFAIWKWFNNKKDKRWLALGGINMGLALGTKHPATITLLCFTVAFTLVLIIQKAQFKFIIKKYLYFILFAFIVSSPWYMKNLVLTGNPLFPQFRGKISEFTAELRDEKTGAITTAYPPVTDIKKIITVPWKVTMGKLDTGQTGPLYLLLLPLLFLYKKPMAAQQYLFTYIIFYSFLWATVGGQYFRRFIPALPVFSLALASHLKLFSDTVIKKKGIIDGLIILLMAHALYHSLILLNVTQNPWGYISGKQSRISYLNVSRSSFPKYGAMAIQWANKNLPLDAKVLFLSEHRPVYIERHFLWHEVHNQNPIVEWSNTAETSEDIYQKFQEEEITHIFFSLAEHMRLYKSYDLYYFTQKGNQNFKKFWQRHIRFMHNSDYSLIYAVLPAGEAAEYPMPTNYILNPPRRGK